MDQILQGIEKCVCKQDDILIGGNGWQENLKILAQVLDRLHSYNLHLKLPECKFFKSEVVYLGLRILAQGFQPVEDKINAVKKTQIEWEALSIIFAMKKFHQLLCGESSLW